MKKKRKKNSVKNRLIKVAVVVALVLVLSMVCGAISYIISTPDEKKEKKILSRLDAVDIKINQLNKAYKDLEYKVVLMEMKTEQKKRKKKVDINKIRHLLKDVPLKDKIPRISIEEAKILFDSGRAIFIDARSIVEYEQAHIKGAISMPVNLVHVNVPKFEKVIENKVLVTYCHGIGCRLSDKTAYKLYNYGYKKVCIFFGGWNQWNEKKYTITKR